jgi:hypothetical protein
MSGAAIMDSACPPRACTPRNAPSREGPGVNPAPDVRRHKVDQRAETPAASFAGTRG